MNVLNEGERARNPSTIEDFELRCFHWSMHMQAGAGAARTNFKDSFPSVADG